MEHLHVVVVALLLRSCCECHLTLVHILKSMGDGGVEISLLWKNLDQGLKDDAIFLYDIQFGVICRSAESLVMFFNKNLCMKLKKQ